MLEVRENPNLLAELAEDLDAALEFAAKGAAEGLEEKMSSSGGPRTGRKYAKYPRRSSAWGEYPQEQFGQLRASVDYVRAAQMQYMVGFFGEDIEKLEYLEFRGDPQTGRGVRRPLFMFFAGRDSNETIDQMASYLERSR